MFIVRKPIKRLSLNKVLARDLKFVRYFLDSMNRMIRMDRIAGCYSVHLSNSVHSVWKIVVKKQEVLI